MYLAGTRSFFLSLSLSFFFSSVFVCAAFPFFSQIFLLPTNVGMYIYTHAILYRAERERERKKIKRRAEHRWVPVAGPLKPQKTVRPSLTLVDGKGGGKVSFLSLSLSLSSSLSLHLSLSLPYVRRCFGGPPSIPPSFLLPTAAVQKTRIRHIEGERGRWIPGKCATVHSRRPQR